MSKLEKKLWRKIC